MMKGTDTNKARRYAEFCDPYRISDVPHVQIGREYFVRASGDRWIWFNDLPEDVADNL